MCVEKENIKVSVIVPIHNAGSNLKKCLDTIINQTLREIEVILVLDSPTDGSDIIAKQYAMQDDRVIILENKENLHIGNSRNRGIDVASGEYLHFSDHDDYRELDMLEKMYLKAKSEDLDMLISNPVAITNSEIVEYNTTKNSRNRAGVLQHLLQGGEDDLKHPWSYYVNVHNVLYKRDLIICSNIRFVDTREITPEDYIFNVECLLNAKRVEEIKENFYYHVLWNGSAGHNQSYYTGIKRSRGFVYMNNLLLKHNVLLDYKEVFYHNLVKNFIFLLFRSIEINRDTKEFCNLIRFYRKQECVAEAFYLYKKTGVRDYNGWKRSIIKFIILLVLFANKRTEILKKV